MILLDVVLGYGSHADPAAAIAPAIERRAQGAREESRTQSRFVGFVCGTDGDPQDLARQEAALRDAGMMLMPSNAQAVRLAARIAATRTQHAARRRTRSGMKLLAERSRSPERRPRLVRRRRSAQAGGEATQIDWPPPAQGDAAIGTALARLVNHPRSRGRQPRGVRRLPRRAAGARGHRRARKADLPGMRRRMILHAGPPIAWTRMCGPMQGAIVGAILFEGWADDTPAREQLAESGGIAFEPCHHHAAVGPMAGIISPSMPVWIVAQRRQTATAPSPTSTRGSARCCASAPTARRCSIA